jgi:methylmalonyl-CoA mutase N-terminal domain/subunit
MSEQARETNPARDAEDAPDYQDADSLWEKQYRAQVGDEPVRGNRSRVTVKPLYGPDDWNSRRHLTDLGFPGQAPTTRGVHASMHRGRPWSPRLVVGFGLPEDYNARMRDLYDSGITGLYVSPCNTHMRGYDADAVDRELLGTCGTIISSTEDLADCLDKLPFDKQSVSLGDTAPYTLSAMMLKVAKDRGIPWNSLAGTTNQSDYLSHYAALHMFFRVALTGQRRLLLDHIEWMHREVPRWNALSVVGQHMQQAGASPAEAMGLTLSSAIQYANDLIERGNEADSFLPRFSFFFDISISFFEEVAKFRAGRRIWNRVTRERFAATDPRSGRFRFHAQTSGADLTRQQPLNNIARVAVQAMAGIFGGLQSLHTDSYDEALGTPTAPAAQIAVATQNILRDEAHLDDVIDPLGGSYYVEALTNEMEAEIESVIAKIDDAGGMYRAVETGLVQRMIGDSAHAWQDKLERGEEKQVGVNAYRLPDDPGQRPTPLERPDPARIDTYLARLEAFKNDRDQGAVQKALDALARACSRPDDNVYGRVVGAALAGATHGEICTSVRNEMGPGAALIVA